VLPHCMEVVARKMLTNAWPPDRQTVITDACLPEFCLSLDAVEFRRILGYRQPCARSVFGSAPTTVAVNSRLSMRVMPIFCACRTT
jgi:hypothetical protein